MKIGNFIQTSLIDHKNTIIIKIKKTFDRENIKYLTKKKLVLQKRKNIFKFQNDKCARKLVNKG